MGRRFVRNGQPAQRAPRPLSQQAWGRQAQQPSPQPRPAPIPRQPLQPQPAHRQDRLPHPAQQPRPPARPAQPQQIQWRMPPQLPAGPLTAAYGRFLEDPTGPEAISRLKKVFDEVERIQDPAGRGAAMKAVARDLLAFAESVDAGMKPQVAMVVLSQLSSQSALGNSIVKEVRNISRNTRAPKGTGARVAPEATGAWGRGGAQGPMPHSETFIGHIQRLVASDPRFRNLKGNFELSLRGCGEMDARAGPPTPPWKRWVQKWGGIFGLVSLAVILGTCGWRAISSRTEAQAGEMKQNPTGTYQSKITPDDPQVSMAAVRAVKEKGKMLNDAQMLDIYHFVTETIEYLNVSDRAMPQDPARTLMERAGDCKAMAVLLASMLERIGAKTMLVFPNGVKHVYIGVRISDSPSEREREQRSLLMQSNIEERYGKRLGDRFVKTAFRDVVFGGKVHRFLLLDPTFGKGSVPGTLVDFAGPENERYVESRPEHPSLVPRPD